MSAFSQLMRNLGPGRMVALGAVVVGLIAFFVFVAGRVATPGMTLLYSDLSSTDTAAIVQQLEAQNVPYQLSTDGSAVSVPSTQVARVRMQLAAEGLPRGGSIGYEIFDKPEGFGTTSFVQSINHLRALEGELARTVGTLAPVQAARVHLVLPKRELFGRGEQKATASVFLRLRGGAGLAKEQIAAIQNLVAASVPQLEPDQISIVDDRGNLLARAAGSTPGANVMQNAEEMRATFEAQQVAKIEELLSKSLGFGRVRAQVSAEMDFDRITTNSETFDPDGQVVRSTQTTTEEGTNSEGGNAGTVSITNNLPAGNANTGAAGGGGGSSNSRSEETVNFEISRTVKSQVREAGNLKRLSVAVVVDGTYDTAEDGTQTYKPRTEEEMNQIRALVRSAVSFDEKRGDKIEVSNMRFITQDMGAVEDTTQIAGFPKADIMRLAETLILAIIGLLVVLLVVRPLLKKAFEMGAAAPALAAAGTAALPAGAQPIALPPGSVQSAVSQALAPPDSDQLEQMIDLNRVEGRVKASAVKKVGEIIEKHPEESVGVLRNWIYQEN